MFLYLIPCLFKSHISIRYSVNWCIDAIVQGTWAQLQLMQQDQGFIKGHVIFPATSSADGIKTFDNLGILSHIPLTNGLFSPICDTRPSVLRVFGANPHIRMVKYLISSIKQVLLSGEVCRSLWYCNTRPTHDRVLAS